MAHTEATASFQSDSVLYQPRIMNTIVAQRNAKMIIGCRLRRDLATSLAASPAAELCLAETLGERTVVVVSFEEHGAKGRREREGVDSRETYGDGDGETELAVEHTRCDLP